MKESDLYLADSPMHYHDGTYMGRIPSSVHSLLRDLSLTFGGSGPYWLDRLFIYGFENEPALRAALKQREEAYGAEVR